MSVPTLVQFIGVPISGPYAPRCWQWCESGEIFDSTFTCSSLEVRVMKFELVFVNRQQGRTCTLWICDFNSSVREERKSGFNHGVAVAACGGRPPRLAAAFSGKELCYNHVFKWTATES